MGEGVVKAGGGSESVRNEAPRTGAGRQVLGVEGVVTEMRKIALLILTGFLALTLAPAHAVSEMYGGDGVGGGRSPGPQRGQRRILVPISIKPVPVCGPNCRQV